MNKRSSVATVLSDVVRASILAAYRAANWNTTRAAEHLGVSRRTLLRWVHRHDLRKEIEKQRT